MMTTTKSYSDTAATATKRSHPADDDERVNDKLNFSFDSLSIMQSKLEATNKSILSALIQHEEEQNKDDKNEMKMLHLLHELPLDTETKEELINEAVSDCNCSDADTIYVVDDEETKAKVTDNDEDTTDADNVNVAVADDDTVDSNKKKGESVASYRYVFITCYTYHAHIICSNTISDLDLINSSSKPTNVKAHHKPMRRRSSLDYIRPPERCLLRNSSLNGSGFRSRSLRDVLEDKEADDSSSISSKDSKSMMRIPRRRIARGNSGKRRIAPMPEGGLPSRQLPRKSSAKGSGSFRGSLRRLMEDKETTDLGLGESCTSLLSSCSLNSSYQRESIDIMDFGVQNDRYSGSSASPSVASSALSLAPSATDGFVGWSRSDSAKNIRINLNPKPKVDQTVLVSSASSVSSTAQRKRCESSSSSVISVDSSGFVNWVNKGQGENSSVHTLSASITSFSSFKKEEERSNESTNNASSSSSKGLLRKLSTGLTRGTSKNSTWHCSSSILFDETATIEDKQKEFMASIDPPTKSSGSRRLLNRLSRSLGSSLRKSTTSSRALRHSLPNTDSLSDDDNDEYSRSAIPRFNTNDVDIGEFHRELYATKKNQRLLDVLFD